MEARISSDGFPKSNIEFSGTSLQVVRLENDKWRHGTWYEIVPGAETTISVMHPYCYDLDCYGIGFLIISLCGDVVGVDETLKIRGSYPGEYAPLLAAVCQKLLEQGYDSVIFYRKRDDEISLTEVIVLGE